MKDISKLKLNAHIAWPYAAPAINTMIPVETRAVPTMGVDEKWRLYWNPDWTAKNMDTGCGVILHELLHLLYKHHLRSKMVCDQNNQQDLYRWNIATDMAINEQLRAEGIKLPEGVHYPEMHGAEPNKTAEHYYRFLKDKESGQSQQGKGPESDQPGGFGGSCADGVPRPWESADGLEEGEGLPEGIDEVDAAAIIEDVTRRIEAEHSKRGNQGGHMERMIGQIRKPTFDPKKVLLRLIKKNTEYITGVGERSFRRPSRRSQMPIIQPSNFQPVPRITIIIDTSGSMDTHDLELCVGLFCKVMEALPNRDGIKVITGDTAGNYQVLAHSRRDVKLLGGGGTDMSQIMLAEMENNPPQMMIVATDGDTPWPQAPLGIPVVAALSRKTGTPMPSWITPVQMRQD